MIAAAFSLRIATVRGVIPSSSGRRMHSGSAVNMARMKRVVPCSVEVASLMMWCSGYLTMREGEVTGMAMAS